MNVEINLKETSQAIKYLSGVDNTYEKGGFYCVLFDSKVHKYPIVNIWRITESYD